MPSDQAHFVGAVTTARTAYKAAPNELAAGGVRSSRQQTICRAVPDRSASGWVGKISQLTSNGDGKGVISVSVGPDIHLATWNNAMSDIGSNTLIDPSSSMFKTLSTLKRGDIVRFSGRFESSKVDCLGEQSITLAGSMTNPAFTMRFTSISKL
ncbi:hypothetical protein ACVIHH_001079 [Bradyrhizobium sp. USDA 4518]